YGLSFYLTYLVHWPEYFKIAESSDGRVMGYVMGKSEGYNEKWHGHVTALSVAPEFRRLGLAGKLMAGLEDVSEKKRAYFVDLFVRVSNDVAVALYKKLGYTVYRRVLEYYSGNSSPMFEQDEDAFDMRKSLSRDPERKSMIPLEKPSRSESGAGFAVYFKGEAVLEMTAGYRDLDYLVPWSHTTLAYGMSICKAVAALCLAQLVDRGFANYSEPVAKYWPEFGQAGKESITLRQLLSHQAGLVGLDRRLTFSEIAENAPVVAEILAKQKPALPLGTVAYHGLTFGLYADQLIRRIDPKGRSIDQYFHEEIAKPA
uniref:N-alpha-acetyltransferase 20 n=1 Tax=Macrostomum lignano TaxID=282301 RepID=A0A1I8IYZ0_9PLAT